ncbi:MAG: hypothetical protein RLZZ479_586, partial [Bacteroidota bacterium]
MNKNAINVRAHTCYLGKTGYNAHARGFFRELSKHVNLRVRNYTWDENPSYLNETDLSILETITLTTGPDKYADFPIDEHSHFKDFQFTTPKDKFQPDVDIVLMDMNHHYFYEKFDSRLKIAYTVWESTRLPDYFVEQLINNFDFVWVVTEWHKQVLSEQGYPISRIHVVNEAVDADFFPDSFDPDFDEYQYGRFKFNIFGRWDFRKSIPEMIAAFLKEFNKDEPVDLIISVDNPYSVDGMNSTEERLEHYGFIDERIKVKHFVSRQDYIKYIKNGHVMLTCARSEGWNIPLIEAMAAGTPALYTDYGAQLEFAAGRGIPVETVGLVECLSGDTYNVQARAGTEIPGYYAQPNYRDFARKMRYAYENYSVLKAKAVQDSYALREQFTWENAVKQGLSFINEKLSPVNIKQLGECVVVLSHADTLVKKMKMVDLVNHLKKEGYTTVLSTHINEESPANFTIIDSNNFVITQETAATLNYPVPVYKYSDDLVSIIMPYQVNYGPAIFSLVKNGLDFALSKGHDVVHFMNYDYYIQNMEVIQSHSKALRTMDGIGCITYQAESAKGNDWGFFSVKTRKLKKVFNKINSINDYYNYGVLFEEFMSNLMQKENVDLCVLPPLDTAEIIKDTESLQTHSFFNLGKDKLHYAITQEKSTQKFILSFFGTTDYEIKVRLKAGNKFFSFNIGKEVKHFAIGRFLNFPYIGIEIQLPSFEQSRFIGKLSKMGDIVVKNWDVIQVLDINDFQNISNITRKIIVHNINGPFVEIKDQIPGKYLVKFIDQKTEKVIYSSTIENNCWTKASREWYTDWRIMITDISNGQVIYDQRINLKNQRVFICFDSSSLGDTLAWIGYADEFRKKHDCKVIVSTFHNELFVGQYPELEFVERGVSVHNIIAQYNIGWFYDGDSDKFSEIKHPNDFRDQEMQKTAADILGLEYKQVRPKVYAPQQERSIQGKYVCIGIHSTAQAKYWNYPGGWQRIVDYLKNLGYQVVLISKESGEFMGNLPPTGIIDKTGDYDFADRINDLRHAEFYIGMGSGLSWLAWAAGTPVVLISGFSDPKTEFIGDDVVRIFNPEKCNSCFNRYRLDAGDWNWCPD